MRRIAEEIKKLARLVIALDDLDFRRFKEIFDRILHEESVDLVAVGDCDARAYAMASVAAQESADSFGLGEGEKAEIAQEAAKVWRGDVQPILRQIEDFLRGRTWNIMKANAIWNEIAGYEAKKGDSFVLGLMGGVMLAVDDYLKAFGKAAEMYLTSSFESIDESGFQEGLESLRRSVEAGMRNLGGDCEAFESRIKSGIESLKSAEVAERRGDTEGVYRSMAAFDSNLDSMRTIGANMGGLFNVFVGYFVGGSANESMYDLGKWRMMQKEFRKRFGIIPSALESMAYAIDKFMTAHGKGNVISGGRDAKSLYRDDVIRCYDSLQSDYINIIRALGNSGVEFDLDAEMSDLKTAIDRM